MNKIKTIHSKKKKVLNLEHCKSWIKPVQISKTVSSIEELCSILILTRRDNVEQSRLVEYD